MAGLESFGAGCPASHGVPKRGVTCLFLGLLSMSCHRTEVPPQIDAEQAATAALKQLDSSNDGRLSAEELAGCPALKDTISRYDTDGDQHISKEELLQRLQRVLDTEVGVMEVNCEVQLSGQPLPGATVKFVPEPFLGSAVQPSEGVTDASGTAAMRLPGAADSGIQLGIYKVEITHPSHQLPARYNTETTLGIDVAPDVRGGNRAAFALKPR